MSGIIYKWLGRWWPGTNTTIEKFDDQLLERLQNGPQNDNMIVARASSTSNKLTRWVIIYQRKTQDVRDEYFKLRYTIHDFEIPNSMELLPEEKVNKKTWYVRKEEEIYELLRKIGISPINFSFPQSCNYPF